MKNAFLMLSMVLATTAACAVEPSNSKQTDEVSAQTSSTESDVQVQPRSCPGMAPGLYYECDSRGFDYGEWWLNAFSCQASCGGRICSADWICHTDCSCEAN